MRIRYAACVLVSLLASTTLCQAATYKVTAVATAAYTNDFEAIPDFNPYEQLGFPAVVEIDYFLDYEGTEGTFGAIVFDSLPFGLAPNPDVPGWVDYNPLIDWNGAVPGGLAPLFFVNGDLGIIDLKNIVASIAARVTFNPVLDPRLRIGTEDPYRLLGTTFFNWDGNSPAGVDILVREAAYRRPSDGLLFVDDNATLLAQGVTIGVPPAAIPEPATLGVAGLGILGVAAFRSRRNFA